MVLRFGPDMAPLNVSGVKSSESFSHLVVMTALAKMVPIRKVLELGSGEWSTPFFLNREAFPNLELLVSYEDSQEWYNIVYPLVAADSRAELKYVPSISHALGLRDLSQFDLCLIDDNDRKNTIPTLLNLMPQNLIVCIHDFENPSYAGAVPESVKSRFIVSKVRGPQTGIFGNFNQEMFNTLSDEIDKL